GYPCGVVLRDHAPRQALAPVAFMALRAREIELALPAVEAGTPRRQERRRRRIRLDVDRHPAGLAAHEGGESEQLPALVGPGRRPLPLGAAAVDLLLEVPQSARPDLGIAGGGPLQPAAVAGGARGAGRAVLPVPQRLAVEQGEERRPGNLVVLHRAGLAAHELVARAALGGRNLACREHRAKEADEDSEEESEKPQTTV